MRNLAKKLALLILAASTICLAFAAGVFLAPTLQRPTQATPSITKAPSSARTERDLALLSEAWRLIERDYYGKPVDQQALVQGAIQGMVNALDDPYSAYLTADQVASSQMEVDGSLQSLGMAVERRDGELVVVTPLTSSPAQRAGIQPGDRILRIDDHDTASLTLGEAIGLLRGPAGSTVQLTVVRDATDPLVLTIERAALGIPLLDSRMLPDSIAYVKLSFFGNTVARDLAAFFQQINGQNLRGIILDLRNNPGGYLDVAIEMAGQFIPEGIIVSQQGRLGTYTWSYRDQGSLLVLDGPDGRKSSPLRRREPVPSVPLVVLLNRGTASAAEVLAIALQDHGKAVLIGERTFGKGAVSGDYTLSDGSSIHMTNGQWLSPKGRIVTGQGVTPDIQTDDVSGEPDLVLQRAVEYVMTR